jgi:CRISPR-associated protein Cas2
MTVFILEQVPATLRGELTRWLLEPKTGVFVGRPTALVREKLWELIGNKMKNGAALLVAQTNNEQGFIIRASGDTSRAVIDIEGLLLIRA